MHNSNCSTPLPTQSLDLQGTYCPMAFVKARIFLDAQPDGKMVNILYEETPSNESLTRSIQSLGHIVINTSTAPNNVPSNPNTSNIVKHSTATKLQLIILTVQVKK